MSVVNIKTKKSPTDREIKRDEILARLKNGELSTKAAANELFQHAGYSINEAWKLAAKAS